MRFPSTKIFSHPLTDLKGRSNSHDQPVSDYPRTYSVSHSLSCIIRMVPIRERGKYMGAMYARIAIAFVIGPVRAVLRV